MEIPDLELYYLAAHLQHTIHWLDTDPNWESALLEGKHKRHQLGTLLSPLPPRIRFILWAACGRE